MEGGEGKGGERERMEGEEGKVEGTRGEKILFTSSVGGNVKAREMCPSCHANVSTHPYKACICTYEVTRSDPLPSTPQGQSRRIHIHVEMTDGGSPLQCDHISSVAIGSIYLRTRYEEPLDSWQEQDLDRLRNKWSDALMNRREFLDSEVRKIVSKKGKEGMG